MELQLNYTCDICEQIFLLDFEKSMEESKIQCPHCNVVYEFSAEDITSFNQCYQSFVTQMKEVNKGQVPRNYPVA
jgi:DNA-directed RNA polymerase subunit RPC12/RpoP